MMQKVSKSPLNWGMSLAIKQRNGFLPSWLWVQSLALAMFVSPSLNLDRFLVCFVTHRYCMDDRKEELRGLQVLAEVGSESITLRNKYTLNFNFHSYIKTVCVL